MAAMIRFRSVAPSSRTVLSSSARRPGSAKFRHHLAALAIAWMALPLTAQGPVATPAGLEPELAFSSSSSFSVGGAQFGPTPDTFFLAFDNLLELHDRAGFVQTVDSLPFGNFVSLLERPQSGNSVYFGDLSTATIRVIDLTTFSVTDTLAAPPNAFSLDVTPAGDVLVAAADASFSTTDIYLLRSGQAPVSLGTFPGPTGPLVVHPVTGDLYYAQQGSTFPPPPGAVTIRRLPAATLISVLASGTRFTLADTSVFASGIDAAFDMVLDDRDRLLVSDPNDGSVEAINSNGTLGAVLVEAATNGRAALSLGFRDGGTGTLDPFQSDSGAELLVADTLFGTAATVQFVRPLQPVLLATNGTTLPRGTDYGLDAFGLPANGVGFVAFGFFDAGMPTLFATGPNGAPILSTIDFSLVPPLTVPVAVDSLGRTSLGGPNSAPFLFTATVEVFAVDALLSLVAVSTPVQLTLQR